MPSIPQYGYIPCKSVAKPWAGGEREALGKERANKMLLLSDKVFLHLLGTLIKRGFYLAQSSFVCPAFVIPAVPRLVPFSMLLPAVSMCTACLSFSYSLCIGLSEMWKALELWFSKCSSYFGRDFYCKFCTQTV